MNLRLSVPSSTTSPGPYTIFVDSVIYYTNKTLQEMKVGIDMNIPDNSLVISVLNANLYCNNIENYYLPLPTPTPTTTPTGTPVSTPTLTPTLTATPTNTPTLTPTLTSTPTVTGTSTSTPTLTSLPTSTPTKTATPYNITLTSGNCVTSYSGFTITGGTAGDIVIVRASFGGIIAKVSNNFTRADLTIGSPDGVGGSVSSPCWSDTSYHGFNITVDCTITMPSSIANVTTLAVTNNSYSSATSLSATIISINGATASISAIGCARDSSTGGTC
jgi:hypothetical protein